jgi:rhomboid protease GluP
MEALVLFGLIGLNGILFLISSSSNQLRSQLFSEYAVIPQAIKRGEVYRLVTSAFFHNDIFHIFLNMYSLFALFPTVIAILKGVVPLQYVLITFLGLYFVSAITAGLVSAGRKDQMVPSLGASGAIFGLLGFLLSIGLLTLQNGGGDLVRSIALVLIINFGVGLMPGFNIDNRGHLGGLIGGVLFGILLMVLVGFKLNYLL